MAGARAAASCSRDAPSAGLAACARVRRVHPPNRVSLRSNSAPRAGPLAGDAATAADAIRELVRRSGSPGLEAAVEGVPDEQVEQTVAWSLDGVDREALLRAGAEEVLRGRAPELLRAVRTAVDEWEVAMLCSTASELYLDACLESLNMAGQCLGNAGAVVLAGALSVSDSVTELCVYGTMIGVEGAEAFGEALKRNTSLTTLRIGQNPLGPEGAAALGQALLANSTLTELYLLSSSIGAGGAAAVGQALQGNTTLIVLDLECADLCGR